MQLDPPLAFFNVVNNIPNTAADSWPLHRLGGAYYNGYVFLSTPRNGVGGYYLDLEVNPFDPNPGALALPPGITWGLRPGGGVVQGRILSRVESVNFKAPTILWVDTCFFDGTGDVPAAVFNYAVAPFGAGSPLANGQFGPVMPTADDLHVLTFDSQPTQVLDFTTANTNGTIYLFWTVQGQNTIWWAEFDGTSATAKGPLVTLPSNTIPSIDATTVQITDPTTGQPNTCLAVVAMTVQDGNNSIPGEFFGWLFDLDGALVQTLNMPPNPNPNPADVDTFSSVIRVAWGALPAADNTATANGLVLEYVASRGNSDFNIAAPTAGANINAVGPLQINVIDLSGFGLSFDWTDMDPSPKAWSANAVATSGPLSVLFPIASPTGAFPYYVGNAAAAISLTLIQVVTVPEPYFQAPQFYLNINPAAV